MPGFVVSVSFVNYLVVDKGGVIMIFLLYAVVMGGITVIAGLFGQNTNAVVAGGIFIIVGYLQRIIDLLDEIKK